MGEGGGAAGVRGAGAGAEQSGLHHQAQGDHGDVYAQRQYKGTAAQKATGLQGTSEDKRVDEGSKGRGDKETRGTEQEVEHELQQGRARDDRCVG